MVTLTWDQVFAWRMARQFITDADGGSAASVARRLAGVQAQVASAAETAVALRGGGAVADALDIGALVKTWAMRGTLHAMTPSHAAAALSLIGSARTWEKPSWQKTFGASPADIAALVDAVGDVLADQPLTRDELVDAIVAESRFAHLSDTLRSGWGTVLKPLAWQGALCHGPMRGTKVTFGSPGQLIPKWPGLPDPDTAARELIMAYLGAYGPATPEVFDAWLSRNSLRKTVLRGWFADLGDAITEVDVEGRVGWVPTEFVDDLVNAKLDGVVRLLGPFDQYVLGPGTADSVLIPTTARKLVSRAAGWISPVVLVDGRVAGTWELVDGDVVASMFDNSNPPPLNQALATLGK
ncbi:winged helix DNA-binding domain-containing protein [Nocardia camponoti]|uniref:Winged helix DNA-binding domain-containing protein n=1 Tax=Nocardia camponoti TaxID=1616106 RepID=A0A917Q8D0_9NOCA|nr:winged helix DNA-binding domain-containing protein [Nocardia camponoti]GGK35569.1 hypothetical protein GCM10011591_04030 [Nocardia camponoti]